MRKLNIENSQRQTLQNFVETAPNQQFYFQSLNREKGWIITRSIENQTPPLKTSIL
jgi:hypothetical protein